MVLNNKIIVTSLAVALLSLSGCGDRAKPAIEGHVYYSDGVLMGITTDPALQANDRYNVSNREGNVIGSITPDHDVYDNTNTQVGDLPCAGTTDDAYDENGFLVGSCNLGISSTEVNRGLSAYEIAVKNGFVGTEAEWLASLEGADGKNGAKGDTGAKGADGADGKDGANGKDGKDGVNGANGKNSLTSTTTLPVSSDHPNGASEIKTGLDTNNNGVLDASEVTNTTIVENGANGQDGAKGDQGNQGTKGDTGELPKQPEYLCPAGDTDPQCGINQEDYKVSKFIFSIKGPLTNFYNDGGLATQGVVSGETQTINWSVERANGNVLPAYSIANKWIKGKFTSNEAPYPAHDDANEQKFRLISRANVLVIESDNGDNATIQIDESGEVTVVNSGLTIEHDKFTKEICFTAEKKSCVSYLVFWEPK